MVVNGTASPFGYSIAGGYVDYSLGVRICVATFAGIAFYNAIELIVLVFITFSQYHGLYFWSILVSSVAVVPYSLGFLLIFFKPTSAAWLSLTLLTVGWYCMVTGQALVLYSRLHFILGGRKFLYSVLGMIVATALFLYIPTTVMTYGSSYNDSRAAYIDGYSAMERIQLTGFSIQELIISGIYIWHAIKMLHRELDGEKRKLMYELLTVNTVIILMDVVLVVLVYVSLYAMETTLKSVIYSIKLKLELAVLGKLAQLVHMNASHPERSDSHPDFPDFVDASLVTSDLTHAMPATKRRTHPYMDSDDISIAIFEHSGPRQDPGTRHSGTSCTESGDSRVTYPSLESTPDNCTDSLRKLTSNSSCKT